MFPISLFCHPEDAFSRKHRALVAFPEAMERLMSFLRRLLLYRRQKIKPILILIFGRKFWKKIINFEALVEEGTISPEDIELFRYVEAAEEGSADHLK